MTDLYKNMYKLEVESHLVTQKQNRLLNREVEKLKALIEVERAANEEATNSMNNMISRVQSYTKDITLELHA